MAGGVAANVRLRAALDAQLPGRVFYAPGALCTDNGAMVAFAGYLRLAAGEQSPLEIETRARWPLDELAVASMDKLRVTGLEVSALIGIHAWERQVRQRLSIDLELDTDAARIAASDDIAAAFDYGSDRPRRRRFRRARRVSIDRNARRAHRAAIVRRISDRPIEGRRAQTVRGTERPRYEHRDRADALISRYRSALRSALRRPDQIEARRRRAPCPAQLPSWPSLRNGSDATEATSRPRAISPDRSTEAHSPTIVATRANHSGCRIAPVDFIASSNEADCAVRQPTRTRPCRATSSAARRQSFGAFSRSDNAFIASASSSQPSAPKRSIGSRNSRRVRVGELRNAADRLQFAEPSMQSAARPQHVEERAGVARGERLEHLLPHALGREFREQIATAHLRSSAAAFRARPGTRTPRAALQIARRETRAADLRRTRPTRAADFALSDLRRRPRDRSVGRPRSARLR